MQQMIRILVSALIVMPAIALSQVVSNLTSVTANGGVSVGVDDNLFIAHFGPLPPNPAVGKNIYKVSPTGDVTLFVDGALNVGSGNAIDHNGFLYQSNFTTGAIYKINPAGVIIDSSYATINGPVGINSDKAGTLYICSCVSNAIVAVTDTGATVFAAGPELNCANGITRDSSGNLYTTNFSDGRITKITPDGSMETIGTTPVGNGHLAYRHANQKIYVASYTGHQIFEMDLSGNLELFAGTGTQGTVNSADPLEAQFNKPNGIAVSNDGCSIYITQDDDVVREIQLMDAHCISSYEKIDDSPIQVFPNPASNELTIENRGNETIEILYIVDVQGRIVLTHKPDVYTTVHYIDVAHVQAGTYHLILNTGHKQGYVHPFVKTPG